MHVQSIEISPSPVRSGRVRVSGRVTYDTPGFPAEMYWYDVAEEHAGDVTTSGNPWLACLLPLAATLGEPLRISAPVDPILLDGATELMHVWRCWYPRLSVVPVEAEESSVDASPPPSGKVAAFFSGGVDSFFTLLRHERTAAERSSARIEDLIVVWGFDVPLHNAAAFEALRDDLQRPASHFGKTLIDVATNLRSTKWSNANWGGLAHGAGLASIALLLESRWRKALIASSYEYTDLRPWGSHPITDALFSTTRLRIVHDGAAFNRAEKTRLIAESPAALQTLRVCWKARSNENCGACPKCYRTMTTLAVLGALDRCSTFPPGSFDVNRVELLYQDTAGVYSVMRDIRALALEFGRSDIVEAIDRSITRSKRLNKIIPRVRALSKLPVLWRLVSPLERALLGGLIHYGR